MNSKVKRIIAIIGLVLMTVFSVSFVLFLIDPDMGDGAVAFVALFSAIGGLVSFLIIKLNQRAEAETKELLLEEEGDKDAAESDEKDGESEAAESDGSED